MYTLSKISNRSLGNFNILGQINNMQKIPVFLRKVFYIRGDFILEVIYQIFILINQFTLFPSREKDEGLDGGGGVSGIL